MALSSGAMVGIVGPVMCEHRPEDVGALTCEGDVNRAGFAGGCLV